MYVAQQFTGRDGRYVPMQETVAGFKKILDGECDDIPEPYCYMAGNVDEVFQRAREAQN
ncbi:ATP synthase subunit beta, sodium ion specific [compost metagenome]